MITFVIVMGDKASGAANVSLFLIEGNAAFQFVVTEHKDDFFFPLKSQTPLNSIHFWAPRDPRVRAPGLV